MKASKVRFELLPVPLPRHPVHARGSARPDRPLRRLRTLNGQVMQKRRKPNIPVLPRHLAHTIQIT
jgi:hypothetical protein